MIHKKNEPVQFPPVEVFCGKENEWVEITVKGIYAVGLHVEGAVPASAECSLDPCDRCGNCDLKKKAMDFCHTQKFRE